MEESKRVVLTCPSCEKKFLHVYKFVKIKDSVGFKYLFVSCKHCSITLELNIKENNGLIYWYGLPMEAYHSE